MGTIIAVDATAAEPDDVCEACSGHIRRLAFWRDGYPLCVRCLRAAVYTKETDDDVPEGE